MSKLQNDVLRVALLPRVSTDEQVLRGYSLQAQEDALVEYANNNNMKIVGIYRDEGHSARKPVLKRPVMLQLLEDVKAGKIDRILFIKLDRWFRNVSEYHSIQRILDENNVTWQAILEDYNTATADGRLKVNIMLSVAENESDRTSERIKFVFNAKMQRKEAFFNLPFGYTAEMIDGVRRVVKDPETQHIVEEFIERAQATSVNQAGLEMNRKYNLTFGYRFWWGITKKDLYFGEYRGIEDYAPAYMTKEEAYAFRNVQTNIKKAQKERIYLFTGLLVCPECGRRLKATTTPYVTAKQHKDYRYYLCERKSVGNCSFKAVNEEQIEQYLLKNIRSEMEEFVLSAETAQEEIQKTKPKKSDIEKLQEKLRRLNVVFYTGNMPDEEYAKESNEIKNQIMVAQQAEAQAEKPVDIQAVKELLKTDFEAIYKRSSREQQRTIWRSVIAGLVPVPECPGMVRVKFKA